MPYLIAAHTSSAVRVCYKLLSSARKVFPVMLEVATPTDLQKVGAGVEQRERHLLKCLSEQRSCRSQLCIIRGCERNWILSEALQLQETRVMH